MFNMCSLVNSKVIKILSRRDSYLIIKLYRNNKIDKKINVQA